MIKNLRKKYDKICWQNIKKIINTTSKSGSQKMMISFLLLPLNEAKREDGLVIFKINYI